jgi:hypothetical protein
MLTREEPKEGSFMKMSSLSLLSLLAASLLIAAGMRTVAQDQDQRRFIDQLKKTPVNEIETGLPNESFDTWFAGLVRPSHSKYEVNDCGERNGTPAERGKEFPTCVAVTAITGMRRVDLAFVVGTYVVPEGEKDTARSKPTKARLFSGSIGPSDPRMKAPTHVVRKLSDLEKLLRP